jgi:glycosyl hydrolase family 2
MRIGLVICWLLMTSASSGAGTKPAHPRRQMLMDGWELHAVADDAKQAELEAVKSAKWQRMRTPFRVSDLRHIDPERAKKVHYAWARHSFTAPPETTFRNALLHLHGLSWGAKLWLNGKEIGEHLGAYGVFEYDISKTIRWGGKNELLVRITGWPKVPLSKKEGKNHSQLIPTVPHGAALYAWGSKQPRLVGAVWVDYFDYARLDRVLILADTTGAIRVRGRSHNYSRNYGKRFVRAVVLRNGKQVATGRVDISTRHTGFSSRTPSKFELKMTVERPALWSPKSPALYRMQLELVQENMILDRWAESFGFRRFEARKDAFYLNGRRIFLRGVCFWGEINSRRYLASRPDMLCKYFIDLPRAANVSVIRNHTIPVDGAALELADRHGMMLLQEFPMTINYVRPDFSPAELALFRGRAISEFRSMLPLYWNHPSVIMWVMTNESPGENAAWENGPLQQMFKKEDPTRPVMRSAEETDEVFDSHCYEGLWSGSEGQFERYAADMQRKARAAGKPLGNTEYVAVFYGKREGKWLGPKPKNLPPAKWNQRRLDTNAQFVLEQTEALRRLGYDMTLPYAWGAGYLRRTVDKKGFAPLPNFYALRSGLSSLLASPDFANRHFVAGAKLDFDLVICDDTGRGDAVDVQLLVVPGEPGFQWPSVRMGVGIAAGLSVTVPAKPGLLRRRRVNVKLPKKPGRYVLLSVVTPKKEPAVVSRRILQVAAKPPGDRLAGRRVLVLAADAKLAADLARLAPTLKFAQKLGEADAILVGPFAHRIVDQLDKDKIRAFVEAGGRVIVLEQDRSIPPLALTIPRLEQNRGGSSTAFRTNLRGFYAWRGLGNDDRVLRRLNGGTGAVVRRPLTPAKGDDVLLMAAQHSTDLNWVVMARRKIGKGEVVFCQMPLHRHLTGPDADPVAQTILINLLSP